MDGWHWKLRRQAAIEAAHEIIAAPPPIVVPPIPVEATPEARPEQPHEEKPGEPRLQLTLF